jgi:long-chain acyl-CoA synthetase
MPIPARWLPHYDRDVPATLAPYPQRTLLDYLSDFARTTPKAHVMLFKGASFTYEWLEHESDALAAALSARGVKTGDRVALLLPNCPQFFVAEMAVWKLGAIVAPMNPTYTEHELEGPLRDHGIETIVTLSRFYHRVKNVQARIGLKRVIVTNIKDYFPPLLKVLFTLAREKKDGDRVTVADDDWRYLDLIAKYRGATAPNNRPGPRDPAVLLMSGGTTGTPKGVLGIHQAYVLTGLQLEAWTKSMIGRGDTIVMVPLPMFHVYANLGCQAHTLVTGNTLSLIPNPRDIKDLLATIKKVKPNFFNGVPTLYVALLNHPDVQNGKVDFRSIKVCFSGASALLADTRSRFETLTGGRIVEGYSLTEGMMALCVNPLLGRNKLGSVGLPLPDVQVGIFDADTGLTEMPAGEVGEICFCAPQLMVGFWNRPDETSEVLRDHVTADGTRRWLHTGDLGYMDDDGYVFIVDRKKDLIKTSGFQVWPREVEEVVASHPAIAEVGVAGVPDERKGELVKAWVVLRQGQTTTEDELRSFCREKLAPYKVPSQVEFRTELPKSMIGKVLRRALRTSTATP